MDKALIIFIKNPEEGKVKTRLAKDIGDNNALIIYNYLLRHTRVISSNTHADRLLFYSNFVPFADEWPENEFSKHIQIGDDLGFRMSNAVDTAFNMGYLRVVIIGSDCIELTENLISVAFEDLITHDFVIGPANDGGYYLLGMKFPYTELFRNKIWSTSGIYQQTFSQIEASSHTISVLPPLSDIDTLADLNEELLALLKEGF